MTHIKNLRGIRVLITRPRPQAAPLSHLLRRSGARVLVAPTIRIAPPSSWAPLDRALLELDSYDVLIFTSANAVVRFFQRAKHIATRRLPTPKRLFAIGPATARELKRYGWHSVGVPDSYEGSALARHLIRKLGRVKKLRILIPRARVARDVLPKTLTRHGAQVRVVEAYRTLPDARGLKTIRACARNGNLDFITFTSTSTVDNFFAALGTPRARRMLQNTTAASIGPITSSTLRHHGVRRIIQAKTFTTEGLVQVILNSAPALKNK